MDVSDWCVVLILSAVVGVAGFGIWCAHQGSVREDEIRLDCVRRGFEYREGNCKRTATVTITKEVD